MNSNATAECCPRFDPVPWDGKRVTWSQRKFVKDRVTSFLHIPLNYGAVMARNLAAIEKAGALAKPRLILTDENSLWGADVYFEVVSEVPSRSLANISGTFLSKVFEGAFSNVKQWVRETSEYAATQGEVVKKLYFFYTTCPKCAKKHGKNYVVLLAQV